MLLLALMALSAVSIASKEGRCANLADSSGSEQVRVVATQYLPKGSVINHRGEGLEVTCQMNPAPPMPLNICRGIFNITTSPSSSTIMEVWLPDESDGRILSIGNRKFDGCIDYPQLAYGTSLGFASVGSNGGHNGTSASALLNQPEVVSDFSWRGVQQATLVAKAVVKQYYDREAFTSYHMGCGIGARQGLRVAQADPGLFDGVIAGAPAVNLSNIVMWYGAVLEGLFQGNASYLTKENWDLVHKELLSQCDDLDGITDDIVEDPRRCQFETLPLDCWIVNRENCLTTPQTFAVERIFSPAVFGVNFSFPGAAYGAEVGLADALQNSEPLLTLLEEWYHYVSPGNLSWRPSDYDTNDVVRSLTEAPDELQPLTPDLKTFRDRGGRILHWHGSSDPLISVLNSDLYYDSLVNTTGDGDASNIDAFYRYFRLSGTGHCVRRGPGADYVGQDDRGQPDMMKPEENVLLALAEWVEYGNAPETVKGVKWVDDDPGKGVELARRHCRYPYANRYRGSGDGKDEDGWVCEKL
ncbi:Feruloyl esterase [Paraconiothyrium brasiliense]|uniref:Carboxylic ester hydrolase n=1 Tax=Paraconiothyrium brasiliense TaxID=300254 RepID=A0ABR3S602_9PLEO